MQSKILPYKPDMPSARTVLIVDGSSEQMFRLLHGVTDAGWSVLLADSAAACITLAAQHKPGDVLLDESLLNVDQWSIAELVNHVSAKSQVVLVAEEPNNWRDLPKFVSRVVPRSDPANVISVLREILA
jgi:DNA-binding NtrC family response regulator